MVIDAIDNKGGVPWWEAPIPRRWHRCSAQSTLQLSDSSTVARCACGATSITFPGEKPFWLDRNSRG